jgi:hypothetical protein
MSRRIIIFGFPHCGTSILKSIIGHITNVKEQIGESYSLPDNSCDYIVGKWPFMRDEFFTSTYQDYIKIFIIRNPLWVFSSLNQRYEYNIDHNHSFERYVNTCKKFLFHQQCPQPNLFLLKYEDLFENDYKNLKSCLSDIGLQYTEDIFDNSKFINKISPGTLSPSIKPDNRGIYNHIPYRTWQINQPLENQNFPSKIDLSPGQLKRIQEHPVIKLIYPNLQNNS